MSILKLIYWIFVENIWCRINGHKFIVIKDIKITDYSIPFDGVQILSCTKCKKTKMAWYVNTKENEESK